MAKPKGKSEIKKIYLTVFFSRTRLGNEDCTPPSQIFSHNLLTGKCLKFLDDNNFSSKLVLTCNNSESKALY